MADKYVGQRIRELRELQKYTREELAQEIQITTKYLYEIECGKKNFSSDILGRISKSLSVSCDYIMFGEEAWTSSTGKSSKREYYNCWW